MKPLNNFLRRRWGFEVVVVLLLIGGGIATVNYFQTQNAVDVFLADRMRDQVAEIATDIMKERSPTCADITALYFTTFSDKATEANIRAVHQAAEDLGYKC